MTGARIIAIEIVPRRINCESRRKGALRDCLAHTLPGTENDGFRKPIKKKTNVTKRTQSRYETTLCMHGALPDRVLEQLSQTFRETFI